MASDFFIDTKKMKKFQFDSVPFYSVADRQKSGFEFCIMTAMF